MFTNRTLFLSVTVIVLYFDFSFSNFSTPTSIYFIIVTWQGSISIFFCLSFYI